MKPKPKKLLDRVRDCIRLKQYSHKTEHAYLNWIRRYILFHKKCTQKKWAQEIWKKKKISRLPQNKEGCWWAPPRYGRGERIRTSDLLHPIHIIVMENAIELVDSPWENVDKADIQLLKG